MELDVLVTGGLVYDGAGRAPVRADVGVIGDRVSVMDGELGAATARLRVDAAGLAVAPGFIDTHTHSDLVWQLGDEHADVATGTVRQGVTTEIAGNCGFTCYPCLPERRPLLERHTGGVFGGAASAWDDLAGFRDAATAAGLHANMAPLVGHGSLRVGVLGFENRAPRDDELRDMTALLEAAFEQGAFGLSTGLIYMPGAYARTDELIALARSVARHGRPYVSHIRGESDMVADSVHEAIRIGREAGLPTHISHHKAAGRRNWGRTEETLGLIHAARAEGTDVTVDVYPYTAGSTVLQAVLPAWAQEGGIEAMVERLRDGLARDRIRREWADWPPGLENLVGNAGWDGIVIAACPGRPDIEGRTVVELASDAGRDEVDFVFDLLVEQRARVLIVLHSMSEGDVTRVLASDVAMVGSDGIPVPGKPHPRWAGTFSRVLGRYSREQRLFDLATAIRKMTSLPAERFGLRGRGVIAPGAAADLVVFDPDTVLDRATYEDPLLPPSGVRDVFVNGMAAVLGGRPTGARAGRVLTPG
jgi:dihydroorotase/N-acyl-D-amino-acid deacylase